MIIVLDIDSIQRVIDPTWIRFLFFVNEQSRDAIFNSRVMKRKCLSGQKGFKFDTCSLIQRSFL
jgi:hypothetical protein